MTLSDQLSAAMFHRDADGSNYDMQIDMAQKQADTAQKLVEFIKQQKELSMQAHAKAIDIIKAQIDAHKAFIGPEVQK